MLNTGHFHSIHNAPSPSSLDSRIRRDFVENEAELSGSEEGSDDEDERGLDRLEMEEGDLEDIDAEDVRDQVGKIHQRQVLDEDQRDVRLFQEAFLEDGELHSDNARSRKFKWIGVGGWKNKEKEGRSSKKETN